MKRFFGLLVFIALFNSCDDGNLEVESFDFTDVQAKSCFSGPADNPNNFFVYKIKDNEALILQIPQAANFPNVETPAGTPRKIVISSLTAAKVIYRLYDGQVKDETICSAIPASSPSVVEEWNAVGGTIEITTSIVNPINNTTGANKITHYSHTIVFRDMKFDIGNGKTQTNELISFGNFNTPAITPVDVTTLPTRQCNDLIFKISGNQVTTIQLDTEARANLFKNEETTVPRKQLINASNMISYKVFPITVTQDVFCAGTLPTPTEVWSAEEGVDGVSGTIEVTTVFSPPNYEHTIKFKNVNFKNTAVRPTFTFGSDYIFGIYTTAP